MDPLTGSAIFGFGRWLVTSQIGRALLLATALGLALWWAYATVWQRGYDVAAAEGDARLRSMQAQIEAECRAREREARATDHKHRDALQQIAAQYEQEKADAQAAADSTIADLRSGTVRLRQHWQGCVATAALSRAAASAAVADDGAELREQGAGDLVSVGEACDAQIRGLQAAIRALTGQP